MARSPSKPPPTAGTQDLSGPHHEAAWLRSILEAAGMVTWEWDLAGDRIRYSDNVPTLASGENISPYCSAAALLQMIHPQDQDALRQALAESVRTGVLFDCEYRVKMQDGRYHWIHGRGKSVVFEAGKPVRMLGLSQDITTRKEAELGLQARTTQLARLAGEMIVVEQRERQRLAEALHENLQQLLVAARVQAHAAAMTATGQTATDLAALQQTLEEAFQATKEVSSRLAPPLLIHRDLPLAFRWLADHVMTRFRLPLTLDVPATLPALPEPVALLLFSTARELLINIAKHAQAPDGGHLAIRVAPGGIELEVRDHGRGFDPGTADPLRPPQGFGLFSIRERVSLIGGTVSVDSVRGHGTRVVVWLPWCEQGANKEAGEP